MEDSPARLLNLMWPSMSQGLGTHYYNNVPGILDQFLVNGGCLKAKSKIKPVEDSVRILQFPEMTSGGRYPNPVRFGRPARGLNQNGFSDHYPTAMTLRES